MSASKTTLFRWKIDDFDSKRWSSYDNETDLVSNNFSMITRSSVQFALNIKSKSWNFVNKLFAIILRQLNDEKPVNVNAKVWLENENGQKFGKFSVEKHAFSKIGDQWDYIGPTSDDYSKFVGPLREKHEALIVCCELIDLDAPTFSPTKLDQEFLQRNWILYEEDEYDAIVQVDGKEFKVLKSFLMSQSELFKKMFKSNFKEGRTSTVNIKDVSENTMQQLIKWFYVGQVEDWSIVEDLFAASDKYDIPILKKACTQHLISTLNGENAFQRFILAVKHNDNVLKESTLTYISKLSASDCIKFTMSHEWIDFYNKHNALAKEVSDLVRQKFNV